MASTQTLTELPVIQETGMDYTSVVSQIKEIIENNNNWSQNWTEFYNSEAGTLLIQLMAWICDNLAVRQDLIYNENYLATATSDDAKRRLLHQIGYSLRSKKAAIVKVALEFRNITENSIPLSNCRTKMDDFSSVKTSIFKFYGKDINGKSIPFEILKVNSDGVPDYIYSVHLKAGNNYYTKDKEGNELIAIQGNTVYKEFTSDTNDSPIFQLEQDLDLDSIKVYDISNQNLMHIRVDNFTDLRVFNGNIPCYVVEQNENGNYQIRYPSRNLVNDGSTGGLFTAGNTICVFYRTCDGSDANIPTNYMYVTETVEDETNESLDFTITNISSGYYGKDAEKLDSAVKDAPLSLVTANRAVTSEDFDRILKRNSLVLKTKTFTPENMPTAFEKYFGRKIMPQEAFSMLILNKQIDSIPDSKLNYFPWSETIKSSILNEKYLFGEVGLNKKIGYGSNKYNNCYIRDKNGNYDITSYYDGGQKYCDSYNYDNKYYSRMLKNALIFSTNNTFFDTISNELLSKSYVMKVKVHNSEEDVLYIDDITNIIGTKDNLTTENNILVEDTYASYTATRADNAIDCKKYKYLKFVLDDTFTITVDLHKDIDVDVINEIAEKTDKNPVSSKYTKDNAINFFEHYYLYVTNDKVETSDNKEWERIAKELGVKGASEAKVEKTGAGWVSIKSYYNSSEAGELRRGIVELIRDAVKEILEYTSEYDYTKIVDYITSENNEEQDVEPINVIAKQVYTTGRANNKYNNIIKVVEGVKEYNKEVINEFIKDLCIDIWNNRDTSFVKEINNYTRIYKFDSKYYTIQFKEEEVVSTAGSDKVIKFFRILDTENNNDVFNIKEEIDEEEVTKQDVMYNSSFADKSIFIDLGMQQDPTLDGEDAFVYLEQPAESENYYRIKIGNDIYAIKINKETFNKMYNFYVSFSSNNNVGQDFIYDYFPYIGKGNLYYGLGNIVPLNQMGDGEINAFLSNKFDGPFSRRKIAESEQFLDKNRIEYNGGEIVKFNLRSIARMLEYAFSPLNTDKDVIYKYNSAEKKWDDLIELKLDETAVDEETNEKLGYVFGGYLRVREIKKSNYPENEVLDLKKIKNLYDIGYENDIRFEFIDVDGSQENKLVNGRLNISSVSENEISYQSASNPLDNVPINDKHTLDLIECLLGNRRQYSSERSDYADNIDKVVDYIGEKDYARLTINSLKKGKQGSIYFIKTAKSEGESELIHYLGLTDGFIYDYGYAAYKEEGYANRKRSRKAYGQRRLELITGNKDDDSASFEVSEGVNVNDIKAVSKQDDIGIAIEQNNIASITIGDIIGTSSDVNYSDFGNIYISYLLSDTNRLQIDKQNNFYYTDDVVLNERAKPPIIGIEGESVAYDSDYECYKIDETKSDFKVKLTIDEVDTNSYYNIVEDTYKELKVLPQKQTKIETNIINGYRFETDEYTNAYGSGTVVRLDSEEANAVQKQVPLIMSIDTLTDECPANGVPFSYESYKNNVIAVNPGRTCYTTGSYIYDQFTERVKNHTNQYLKNNCYAFVNKYYNTNDKLIFSSVVSNSNTNITFYYPDETAFTSDGRDLNITVPTKESERMLAVKMFYKMLFGTNKTNKEFYTLYPKDEMLKINDENIISYIDEGSGNENSADREYFYCPKPKYHLKFIYRTFIDSSKTESKFGDYYITCENNGNHGFNDGYKFFINKTEGSVFPDKGFYLHFINDRTYEPNRNTEEDVLNEYMKKHQIIGTEFHVLKPYFKTFDIKGVVKYNANYSVSDIKPKVENALKEKYRISSVKDLDIGNSIYRSDIFKTILSLEGVDGFELEYFGYDYTNKVKYPDQKYSLNVLNNGESKIGPEFYIMSILATSNGKHGIMLEYEPKQETI